MELSTRRVEIGGIASGANGLWMTQIARNLTDGVDGFFKGKRYIILNGEVPGGPHLNLVCFLEPVKSYHNQRRSVFGWS
jgi:hypothetical protein